MRYNKGQILTFNRCGILVFPVTGAPDDDYMYGLPHQGVEYVIRLMDSDSISEVYKHIEVVNALIEDEITHSTIREVIAMIEDLEDGLRNVWARPVFDEDNNFVIKIEAKNRPIAEMNVGSIECLCLPSEMSITILDEGFKKMELTNIEGIRVNK